MLKALIIFLKELKDNLRDRRSLFFALIYGPILMPALTLGPIVYQADKHVFEFDSGREFHIVGEEFAPNFVSFLRSKNLDAKVFEGDVKQKLLDEEVQLVVEVSKQYPENLSLGTPAKIIIHYNKKNSDSQNLYWQIRSVIDNYSRIIASQRLSIRGFDETILQAIDMEDNDVSEEEQTAGILGNLIVFVVLFSSMMGGFYLAVDAIAGEKERLSLEPLLGLALSSTTIILGKYLVVLTFCCISTLLPIVSTYIWTLFIPNAFYGDSDIPSLLTFLKLLVICLPIAIFEASLMTLVAASARSVKEAQTQLGFAMIIPIIPFFAIQFLSIKDDISLQWVPFLAQYSLAEKVVQDVNTPLASALPSCFVLFVLTITLLFSAINLYRSEKILSN